MMHLSFFQCFSFVIHSVIWCECVGLCLSYFRSMVICLFFLVWFSCTEQPFHLRLKQTPYMKHLYITNQNDISILINSPLVCLSINLLNPVYFFFIFFVIPDIFSIDSYKINNKLAQKFIIHALFIEQLFHCKNNWKT